MGRKATVINITVFAILSALPIARIHALLPIIPLYAAVLTFLSLAKKCNGITGKILLALAIMGSVGLLAIYVNVHLPRRQMISLGVAITEKEVIPEILFLISGIYALFTVTYQFRASIFTEK